jgi:hypothetical protein
MQAPAIGATATSITDSVVCISPLRPAPLVAPPAWEIWANMLRNAEAPAPTTVGPMRLIISSPTITTTEPPRSLLRATWPFSRARLRCLGVAFSVRSSRGIV